MPDETLLSMFDEVRSTTLQMLTGVDDEAARWHPPKLSNSILWHAGHAYAVVEWLTMQSLGRTPESPVGWFEAFGWDSRPAEVSPESWPKLETVVQLLCSQHVRLRSLLATLSEVELSQPSVEWPDRSVRQMILHALQDEASHKGEIWLLRKLYLTEG